VTTLAPGLLETHELMLGCFKRIRHLFDSELSRCGLSLSRFKILSQLSLSGPQHQGALAATFGLAPRTVTELIDTLERDGLVERHTDPADRRARHVHLTPAGEHARAQALAIRGQIVNRVLGRLSEPVLTGLLTALQTIERELDQIDAGDGVSGSAAETPTNEAR
jgi:DNA-binding MarR family transcriptional regulator